MKLAMSNIAWAPEQRLEAYAIMQGAGLTGLEIAPGLFFFDADDPFDPAPACMERALAEIAAFGLSLVSMQSLLFGVENASLFGSDQERANLRKGLERAIALAGRLAIPNIVFGSPGQRVVPDGMTMEQASEEAAALFRELGELCRKAQTCLAIEFNPAAYGTNFLTDFVTAHDFALKVDHPCVTLNFDVGAMHMNEQFDDLSACAEAQAMVSHVHISEPQLAPAPAQLEQAAAVMRAFDGAGYKQWYSIEMTRPVGDALATLRKCAGKLALAKAEAAS